MGNKNSKKKKQKPKQTEKAVVKPKTKSKDVDIRILVLGDGNSGKTTFYNLFSYLYANFDPKTQNHIIKREYNELCQGLIRELFELLGEKLSEWFPNYTF